MNWHILFLVRNVQDLRIVTTVPIYIAYLLLNCVTCTFKA
uniref:Uncharacterized protein n=1 Tax=Arundo donax TaxID=35708 RepID=A0A0A8ZAR3_ARUDO